MLVDFWLTSSATTLPSMPQLSAICLSGASRTPSTMSTPIFSSPLACARAASTASVQRKQGHAAAGQNAFFDRRTRGVQGVFDAGLLLLHVGFGLGADGDDRHAAGELGQPLLELLLVVLALGLSICLRICWIRFWMSFVLPAPSTIVVLFLSTVIFLARPSCVEREVLELDAEVFADQRAAGEHGDVAQHRLAAIAEAGGLHGADVEHAAELVDDQGRQRFAFDVFGDDQQRLAGLARPFPGSAPDRGGC